MRTEGRPNCLQYRIQITSWLVLALLKQYGNSTYLTTSPKQEIITNMGNTATSANKTNKLIK